MSQIVGAEATSPSSATIDTRRQETMAAVAAIWERSKETVCGRVAVLEQAAMSLLEGALGDELRRQAERDAHKLAGSLGTFGFAQGSQLAKEVELLLQGDTPLEGAQILQLSELVLAVRQEIEQGVLQPPAPPQPVARETQEPPSASAVAAPVAPFVGSATLTLLIVSGRTEFAEQLVVQLASRGQRAMHAVDVVAARALLAREQPEVVLLDISVPAHAVMELALLVELTARMPPMLVVVLSESATFSDRLQIARLGGSGFLQKPVSVEQVVEFTALLRQRGDSHEVKVLAVDDDPAILAILQTLLAPRGITLTTLDDPRRFWDVLQKVAPDLLVLDMEMPHINGVELCRVVRNDPRWRDMPVLFLTAAIGPERVGKIFTAGADDYVQKPLVGPELLTRILNRLERIQLSRAMAEVDALTGVVNQRKGTHLLERFLRLAVRNQQPFSIALLSIDSFTSINEQYGHEAGNGVLHRLGEFLLTSLRSEDVVARWDGEEFLVGLYGLDRDTAVRRLTGMFRQFHEQRFSSSQGVEFQVTLSAGVAGHPFDGKDLPTLCQLAYQALSQAKTLGRNRVLPIGWCPDVEQSRHNVDIALVDDDVVLGELLVQVLTTRGFTVRWFQDGQDAVEKLGGLTPKVNARVVLLDVDLPGLDGFSVLRCLAHDGLLAHSQVLMLTARAVENEVIEAFKLGATDHVAKPFSISVLIQRVQRMLKR